MNRYDLECAYSVMELNERRKLAEHMGYTMQRLYTYCLRRSSDRIGKERYKQFLKFKSENEWMELAKQGRKKREKPTVLTINFGEMIVPDIVMIGSQKYIKA